MDSTGNIHWDGTEQKLEKKTPLQPLVEKMQVVYHSSIEVTSGFRNDETNEIIQSTNPEQVVDHVLCPSMLSSISLNTYCLVVDVSHSAIGKQNAAAAQASKKCQLLVHAAYHAVYLLAMQNRRKKIFLQLVGMESLGVPCSLVLF